MTLMKFYKRKSFDTSYDISISLQSETQYRIGKQKKQLFPLLCQTWKCCLCYLLPCIVVTRPLGGVLLSAAIFFHFTQFWDRWLRKKELQMNLIVQKWTLYWTFNSFPCLSPLSCPHPFLPALLLLYRQWRRLIRNDKSYISSQTRKHVTKATFLN